MFSIHLRKTVIFCITTCLSILSFHSLASAVPQTSGGETTIRLKHKTFDPLYRIPSVNLSTGGGSAGEEAKAEDLPHLVQFHTTPGAAHRQMLNTLGLESVAYIPKQSLVVFGDAAAIEALAAHSLVRWVGEFSPDFKIEPDLLAELRQMQGVSAAQRRPYNLALFSRKAKALQKFGEDLSRLGVFSSSLSTAPSKHHRIELTAAQVLKLLSVKNVQYIDRWSPPEADMDIVRNVGGANAIELSVPAYDGAGVRGEVMDVSALWDTHEDFNSVLIHGANGDDYYAGQGHGTLAYGIVFGDGSSEASARGLLPGGTGIYANRGFITNRAQHTAELVDPLGPYRAVFQSNSWGNGRTTDYTSLSAELDQIVFDNDLLVVQSQSNSGTQLSRPQAWSKNVVSVGGINHHNTESLLDDAWNNSASIGPAADGRIKPDLSHFYDSVLTTGPGACVQPIPIEGIPCEPDFDDNDNHFTFGGTSAATPITAGYFGLMFKMWADGLFTGGAPGSGGDVFDARPHASTAKALMINTAQQYDFSGDSHDLTRVHQGWGLANVDNLYTLAEGNNWQLPLVVNEEVVLQDQEAKIYTLEMLSTAQPWIRTTLVYTDPPGSPAAAVATVNDLNLKVTSPSGVVYWGNVGLKEGNWSTSGGSANPVDTVENVFVQHAETGVWTLEVNANSIAVDAHIETAAVDADFALIVTCGEAQACMVEQENGSILSWLVPVLYILQG